MKLNEIYLDPAQEEVLIEKTEQYNRLHPDEPISFQMMAERLLEMAIYGLNLD